VGLPTDRGRAEKASVCPSPRQRRQSPSPARAPTGPKTCRAYLVTVPPRPGRAGAYKVRPELVRAEKHARLVGYGDEWVSPSNYRAPEVPPLRDAGSMGELCPFAQAAVDNLLTQGDALSTPSGPRTPARVVDEV